VPFADLIDDAAVVDALGDPATLSLAGESPVSRSAIYRAPHVAFDFEGQPVNMPTPSLFVRRSDCPRLPARFDQVTVAAGTFSVADVREDEFGGVLLVLENVPAP
jgi:hypothetical protein